jgi:branched-subunit amino acid transport protein
MNAVVALAIATLGTFALRSLSVRVFSTRELDPGSGLALRYAALSIIASLVVQSLPDHGDPSVVHVPVLAGTAVAVVAGRCVRNITGVIVLAVATYAGAVAIGLG